MQLRFIAPALVLTASLVSGAKVPDNLPDGTWKGIEYPNGTTITISLSDTTMPPIITHEPRNSSDLSERGSGTGSCWGYFLDHDSTNMANLYLQATVLQDGSPWIFCSPNQNMWIGVSVNFVLVYFCIDAWNECIVFNSDTIIPDGMGLMDAICQPYEASWALYPNYEPSRFLMGKCAVGSAICE